jgi:uncharacterized protein YeaO (DUF488 family)
MTNMIKVKHLMDAAERDDGQRIWVEPVNLTKDLQEWCGVEHILTQLGPPESIWRWFQEHPDGYECFRGEYHIFLANSPFKPALQQLACAAQLENFTLLHQGDDPAHNTATALHEFLSELEAYCRPE